MTKKHALNLIIAGLLTTSVANAANINYLSAVGIVSSSVESRSSNLIPTNGGWDSMGVYEYSATLNSTGFNFATGFYFDPDSSRYEGEATVSASFTVDTAVNATLTGTPGYDSPSFWDEEGRQFNWAQHYPLLGTYEIILYPDNIYHAGVLARSDQYIESSNSIDGTISLTLGTSLVPVPAAVWLFGSGLIGLVGFARRKEA